MAEIICQKKKEKETAERILQTLKEKGCRITKQRRMLLNVILQEECASCKEIYYKAKKEDAQIGMATIYRMINLLEEIGVISRKNMYTLIDHPEGVSCGVPIGYKVSCCMDRGSEIACVIELDDHTIRQLTAQHWFAVVSEGLKACGYADGQRVTGIMLDPCMKAKD